MNATLTIQEKLKGLRVVHGLTLEQLEKQTGISKSALGSYETEEKDIIHTSIVMLAKYYGVSTDYLLGLKDFAKMLAEIEIYVDGIPTMQIQNLNAWVDVARVKIMEKYHPAEQDKDAYWLQAAHIWVHEGIDSIIGDIKDAHREDSPPRRPPPPQKNSNVTLKKWRALRGATPKR